MLDGWFRPRMDPWLDRAGVWLADHKISADQMTALGLGFGLAAAGSVALGAYGLAVVFLLLGRLADGLDGAIARAGQKTDLGGYHDIVADFVFYGAMPLGFAVQGHGLAAAFLLFSFYVNGASFLAFAILAAKRGMESRAQGEKSLFYAAGLMEGAETIAFFVAMCLFPMAFAPLATVFGLLCLVTAAGRVLLARRVFGQV